MCAKCLDRLARANSVKPDQMPKNVSTANTSLSHNYQVEVM